MKKTLGILGSFLLGICALLLLAVFLVPAIFGWTFNTIMSGSMEPTIKTGSMIIVDKSAQEKIQVGDIIAFRVKGIDVPICHRVTEIVEIERGRIGFSTQGDANEEPDSWIVMPENLEGKIVFHIAGLGYIAKFVKSKAGFGLLIGLPAIIIIASEINNIFRPKSTVRKRPN